MSPPEEKVAYYLDNNNIFYIYQKTFADLLSDKGYSLRYDFYLPKNKILLEVQGYQHFFFSQTGIMLLLKNLRDRDFMIKLKVNMQ